MKKLCLKIISLFMLILLVTTATTSQQASAQASARTIPSSSSWDITFIEVGSGVPYYSTYKFADRTTTFNSSYNLTTNCVMVTYKVNSNCPNRWIWIDGINRDNAVLCGFQSSGDYSYLTYAIPNLTPGTHTLQLRVLDPTGMSTQIKKHNMTIVVP